MQLTLQHSLLVDVSTSLHSLVISPYSNYLPCRSCLPTILLANKHFHHDHPCGASFDAAFTISVLSSIPCGCSILCRDASGGSQIFLGHSAAADSRKNVWLRRQRSSTHHSTAVCSCRCHESENGRRDRRQVSWYCLLKNCADEQAISTIVSSSST